MKRNMIDRNILREPAPYKIVHLRIKHYGEQPEEETSFLYRNRNILATGAAIVAGIFLYKNPAYIERIAESVSLEQG
jgi:hypothetical protein